MILVEIRDTWNKCLDLIPDNKRDIYFFEEYVKLYQDDISKALCVVAQENDNILLLPIIRRQFETFFDFETPYGYGGPLVNTDDIRWIESALQSMKQFLVEQRYIAGFIRFHPLLHNNAICCNCCEVGLDRQTVVIDLLPDEDSIFSLQLSAKNRNMVRKALSEGLVFCADYDFVSLKDFIRIYGDTMSRLSADDFYFFDEAYYQSFAEMLRKRSFLGCVKKDGEILAAALFMYSRDYGHYHLAGSVKSSYHGVNNLLLWQAALELKKQGVKIFHLGGGLNDDPENSLFKFKKSFSHTTAEFYIGKMIFNEDVYSTVCQEWEQKNPDKASLYKNRLLKYRY